MIRKRITTNSALPVDVSESESMMPSDDVVQASNFTLPVPVVPVLSVPAKKILNNTNVKNLKNFRVIMLELIMTVILCCRNIYYNNIRRGRQTKGDT